MSIESVMPSNQLIPCHPPLLLPSVFPSIRVYFNELAVCTRWTKYWRFSYSISPSSEYSGLISFRIDWFDLLAVQGTLKSLLQHQSINFLVLSLLYAPALTSVYDYWKNHSFDYMDLYQQSDVSAFYMLFRLTPVFLPGEFHGQEPGGLQSVGSQRAGHDWVTNTFTFTLGFSWLFFQRASIFFNFRASVTIHNDFRAQENKVFYCFHFSPIYLPLSKSF